MLIDLLFLTGSELMSRVNDMSLHYGGKFDIYNNWTSSHAEHRIGQNADIGLTFIDADGNCINWSNPKRQTLENDLVYIMTNKAGLEALKEGDHRHLRTIE